MPKDKQKTTRVQLELPEKSIERLQALRSTTEASSYAEVIRNALRLYELATKAAESGGHVYVRGADGVERLMLSFSNCPPAA